MSGSAVCAGCCACFRTLFGEADKYRRDKNPVSGICDCYLCRNFSRAYLRHLLTSKDPLGMRLATIHNLRFYTMYMEGLRHGGV